MPDFPTVDAASSGHPVIGDQLIKLGGRDANVHRRLLAGQTAAWKRADFGEGARHGDYRERGLCEVIEGIARRAERRLVVPAGDGDGAGCVLDRRAGLGERRPLPAAEQPDQASLVIAGQSAVARMWLRGWCLEPGQLAGRPAERLGLVTPPGQEASAILDGGLPAVEGDEVAGFEVGKDTA